MSKSNAKWNETNTAKLLSTYETAIEGNEGEALNPEQFEQLADQNGVTVASARQKLTSLKAYIKPDAVAVGKASSVRKAHIVKQIADTSGLTVDSLEKGNKQELEALAAFIDAQAAIIEDYESVGETEA